MNKMVSPFLLAAIIVLSFGISGLFLKVAVTKLGPGAALFWTVSAYIATDILLFFILLSRGLYTAPTTYSLVAVLAGITGFGGLIGTYWLFNKMNASIASPLTALYPAITVVLAVLVLKEKIKLVNGVGVLLALAAAVLLAL